MLSHLGTRPCWEICELEIRIYSRATGQLHFRLHLDACGPIMTKGTGPAVTWPSAHHGVILQVLTELVTQRNCVKSFKCTINHNGMGF